ncbi:MAG: YihA family ribosome biogenesis GTP-binding protein [Deltaproteobacteria bacterium]|nr:YihA family ribosome biogenesis GTP-binding protein [Deltaproteobacteria bacterium]
MKILSVKFVKSAREPLHYPSEDLPEVAFAGRSNVGKSSLINRLVQRKGVARTGRMPGTTQLINFFTINDRYSFADLPGYGFAKVPETIRRNWGPMVESYLKQRKNLQLVLLLLDIRREPSENDVRLRGWLDLYHIPHLAVLTKADKLSRSCGVQRQCDLRRTLGLAVENDPILFSAKTGEGRQRLWQQIESYCLATSTP